jgi:hypothetical protein
MQANMPAARVSTTAGPSGTGPYPNCVAENSLIGACDFDKTDCGRTYRVTKGTSALSRDRRAKALRCLG